jgi:hypothetical protein
VIELEHLRPAKVDRVVHRAGDDRPDDPRGDFLDMTLCTTKPLGIGRMSGVRARTARIASMKESLERS